MPCYDTASHGGEREWIPGQARNDKKPHNVMSCCGTKSSWGERKWIPDQVRNDKTTAHPRKIQRVRGVIRNKENPDGV